MIVVADPCPLIHLSGLGLLDLLPRVYGRVLIPHAVFDEVAVDDANQQSSIALVGAAWVELVDHYLGDARSTRLREGLELGAAAGIWVAENLCARGILADDPDARRGARKAGIKVRGTLGTLVEARRQGWIAELSPLLIQLRQQGGWMDEQVLDALLGRRPGMGLK